MIMEYPVISKWFILVGVVGILLGVCKPENPCLGIIFTSDGFIQEGDSYSFVDVYDTPPDTPTIEMSGGFVNILNSYNYSTVNLNGGDIFDYFAHEQSTANTYGGNVVRFGIYNQGTVNIASHHEAGMWRVNYLSITDEASNQINYHIDLDDSTTHYVVYGEDDDKTITGIPLSDGSVTKN